MLTIYRPRLLRLPPPPIPTTCELIGWLFGYVAI